MPLMLTSPGPYVVLVWQAASVVVGELAAELRHAADAPDRAAQLEATGGRGHPAEDGERAAASGTAPGARGEGGGSWDAWQVADAIWSGVVPLLRHPDAAPAAFPLLLAVLPLLYAPPAQADDLAQAAAPSNAADSGRAADVMPITVALWRGYLDAICSVLRFHRLMMDAGPAAAAAAEGVGATLDDDDEVLPWPQLTPSELPLLLIALATVSACPHAVLRAAAPPGLDGLLARCTADPFLAMCAACAPRTGTPLELGCGPPLPRPPLPSAWWWMSQALCGRCFGWC